MITLHHYGPGFGLPETSPFVIKTEIQLKIAGLAYRKEPATPAAAPKGQLPFIDDDGQLIADSTFIRFYVEREYAVDFDRILGPEPWAQAWALEKMLENQLYWAMVWWRWMPPENFAKGPAKFFEAVPAEQREAARQAARARVADALRFVGVGRHSPDEIVELARLSLASLSLTLGEKPYLFGEEPCGVDATAFGLMACIQTPYFDTPLRQAALQFDNLTAYVERMMARFYPDFPWRTQPVLEAEFA